MAWFEGEHTLKGNQLARTNETLAQLEGEITSKEAQSAFAKYCFANPSFAAQLLMGVDLYPFQDIMIRTMMQKDYFLGICSRGLGKSTIAGVFIPLYAIFNPGVTIGVTSATFRQSRAIFEKIEAMASSPRGRHLKHCFKGEPKHKTDAWEMQIGESKIVAIPLGCFAEGHRVRTNKGQIKIETNKKDWSNSDMMVETIQGEARCSHVLNAGEKECFQLTTKNGYVCTVTEEHQFCQKDGYDYHWRKTKDLLIGEEIGLNCSNYFLEQPKYNLSSELGLFYGEEQAYSEIIDERIFSCSREFGRGFLNALFTYCRINGNRNRSPGMVAEMPSEEVAIEIQRMLLCYGLKSERTGVLVRIASNSFARYKEVIGTKLKVGKDYLKSWKKAEIFYDEVVDILPVGKRQTYDLRVPAQNNYLMDGFVCHNSGDKIRGYRFNLLVIDELLLLSERVINEVLLPFMAVQHDQRDRQKVREAETQLIEAGLMKKEDMTIFPNNKLIGLTSASYEFEYLYTMFSDYKRLIYDKEAEHVSHAIMQLSCEMAPEGLYDKSNVDNAKKSFTKAQYEREYMARFTGDSSGFYSARTLHEITLPKGSSPTMRIKGDPSKGYILAIDPNYDSSEGSDHFAMWISEVDPDNEKGFMVHAYAVASCSLAERMEYIKYIFDSFNIVYVIVDRAGGEKFIKDINDLGILDFELAFFEAEFETFSPEELFEIRKSYNNGGKVRHIVHSQQFTSQWIRFANETLAGAIEGKRIYFGSPPEEPDTVGFDGVPIASLVFLDGEKYKKDQLAAKKIDFIEHQTTLVKLTKNQCAMIEVSSSANGSQRFDLPPALAKQTGPNKPRKDSYSALLLNNWGLTCYFALLKTPEKKKSSFKPRFLV